MGYFIYNLIQKCCQECLLLLENQTKLSSASRHLCREASFKQSTLDHFWSPWQLFGKTTWAIQRQLFRIEIWANTYFHTFDTAHPNNGEIMSNLLSLHWYHISIFRIKSLVIVTNGFGRSTGWRRPFGHSCRKALWDHLRGQSQTQNPFGSFDGTLAQYHLVFWMFTLMGDFRQPQTGMGVPYFEGNLSRKNSDVLSNGKPVGLPLGQIRISWNNFIWIEPLNVIGCHYTASGMVLDLFKPITGSGSIFGHYGFQFLQHWHVAIHFEDAANQTQNVVLSRGMQWIHCYKTLTIFRSKAQFV